MLCITFATNVKAQFSSDDEDKSEYRYWSFVVGMNHGFGAGYNADKDCNMLHTDRGDMYRQKGGMGYLPGAHIGFLYNLDFKNNTTGVVMGVEFADYGFQNKYKTRDNDLYTFKDSYRAMGVSVPILFKFSGSDIYKDMFYISIGARANYIINATHGENGSWTTQKYGEKLEGDALKKIAVAGVLGFNIKMFAFNIDYTFMNFVNNDYTINQNGTQYKPFEHIKGNITIYTSLNVPLTRWLTIHNWTAEKIRRKLRGTESSY